MSINYIFYYFKEGFLNLFKNKKSTFASIIIMSCTLILFGVFYLLSTNLNKFVDTIKSQENMQVFIMPEATETQVQELKKKISEVKINGKNQVLYIKYKSNEDAANDIKKMFEGKAQILRTFDKLDFLPASFVLKLENLENGPKVKAQIESFENVKSVNFNEEIVGLVLKAFNVVKYINIGLILILTITSIFIISNTIKLTVYARRKEISIMKYVGASDDFIRGPFILESMYIGILSTILPFIALFGIYRLIENFIITSTGNIQLTNTGVSLVSFVSLIPNLFLIFLGFGIGISVVGSMFAIRKYLKV